MIVPTSPSLTMVLAVLAALAYLGAALGLGRSGSAQRIGLWTVWALHLMGIVSGVLSDTPRFGFGPALSVTAWLALSVYGVEHAVLPRLAAQRWLMALGALAVLLGAFYPGQPLREYGGPLMAAHLALGIASYGLFAAAVVHGWLMQNAEKRMRTAAALQDDGRLPLLTLERLTFRFAQAGFVLLTATLVAGLFFGEQVYGRAWAWRHKEVFAVLAWLVFAALLLARWQMGLRGKTAVHLLNIGALLLLLAYVGSRFVLEVVLER